MKEGEVVKVQTRENKLVTIIIRGDKKKSYIEETIQSLLAQTYTHNEILVVTREDQPYASYLPHIRTITYPQDQSIMTGYNLAVQAAQGEAIAFIKAGDLALPQRIETQLKALQQDEEVVLVCSDMQVMNSQKTQVEHPSYYRYQGIPIYEEDQTKHLIQTNFVSGSTIMLRKEVVGSIFPMPENLPYEDWWIGVIASLYGKIRFMDEALVACGVDEHTLCTRHQYIKQRVSIANSNSIYYQAFADYFRKGKHHYLAVVQPMELRDTLMSTYSLKERMRYYYSERTYMCRRKIRLKEKLKIQGYLWMGPYLLTIKK